MSFGPHRNISRHQEFVLAKALFCFCFSEIDISLHGILLHRCPQFQMRYPHFLHLATIFFNPSKPSNNMAITCSYCQKKFTSNRGLTQHQQRNEKCFRQLSAVAGTGPKPPQASCGVALSALNLAKQCLKKAKKRGN